MQNMRLVEDALEAIGIRFKSCDVGFLITFTDDSTLTNQMFYQLESRVISKEVKRIDILNKYADDILVEQMYRTASFMSISSSSSNESNDSKLIRIIEKSDLLNKQLNEFQKILNQINSLKSIERMVVIHYYILKTNQTDIAKLLDVSKDRVYRLRKQSVKNIVLRMNLLSIY